VGRGAPQGDGETHFDDWHHLGLSAMKNARFWTGVLMLAALAMTIRVALSPHEAERDGPVQGTVMYHGRPVAGGTIFFLAEGRLLGDAVHATIVDGHYRCETSWRGDRTTPKWFRIFVVLSERDERVAHSPAVGSAGSGVDDGSRKVRWTPDEGPGPPARVVRASMELPGLDVPKSRVVPFERHRFSSPDTSDLAVRLGAEAARVDVELND
jgi:hypothetical protein